MPQAMDFTRDEDLVSRFQRGDRNAFDELMQTHMPWDTVRRPSLRNSGCRSEQSRAGCTMRGDVFRASWSLKEGA